MTVIRNDLAVDTRRYWSSARLASRIRERWGRVDDHLVEDLRTVLAERPSELLACAIAGTLASLGCTEAGARRGDDPYRGAL